MWGITAALYADALAQSYTISLAASLPEAGRRLQQESVALIMVDLRAEAGLAVDLIGTLRKLAPTATIIAIAAAADAPKIVAAVKAGAADVVAKPIAVEPLRLAVGRALKHLSLKHEIDYLRR
ncbi:MAG: response regulator [Anaerolineae bacterium]